MAQAGEIVPFVVVVWIAKTKMDMILDDRIEKILWLLFVYEMFAI